MLYDNDPPSNLEADVAELFAKKMREFAAWASENWTTTPEEAETLTNPTDSPNEYARGYNEGIASIPDALDTWLEGFTYS